MQPLRIGARVSIALRVCVCVCVCVFAFAFALSACALVMSFDHDTSGPGPIAIRGVVEGLEANERATLVLNGGERLTVGNESFEFRTRINDGAEWVVAAEATGHKCDAASGRGSGADAVITIRCRSTNAGLAELTIAPGDLRPRPNDGSRYDVAFEKPLELAMGGITTNVTVRTVSPSATVSMRGMDRLASPASASVMFGGGAPLSLEVVINAAATEIPAGRYFVETKFAPTYIKPSNTPTIGARARFGKAIGLSGATLAIAGGKGVYVFRRTEASWAEETILEASRGSVDVQAFGTSVAISGDTIAIGDPYNRTLPSGEQVPQLFETGAVYIFRNQPGAGWKEEAFVKAVPPDTGSQFGGAVALDGDTFAASAPRSSGGVQIFRRTGVMWAFEQSLMSGTRIASGALSVVGDDLVVGVPGERSGVGGDAGSGPAAGAVHIFHRTAASWSEIAVLRPEAAQDGDDFGSGVSLSRDGMTLAIGSPGDASRAGAVHVYRRDASSSSSSWVKDATYIKPTTSVAGSELGASVAIAGNVLIAGAPGEKSNAIGLDGNPNDVSAIRAGALFLFMRGANGQWTQRAYIKAPNTRGGAELGRSVAYDDGHLASGSPEETGAASGVNGDMNLTAQASGAVYVW